MHVVKSHIDIIYTEMSYHPRQMLLFEKRTKSLLLTLGVINNIQALSVLFHLPPTTAIT